MNALQRSRPRARQPEQRPTPAAKLPAPSIRHGHRERDYGIGYGNSSGYATLRRFTDGHVDPIFRLG